MAASEERDEEAQGLRGAELEAARVRGDESEGETPYEPSDGDEPEHAISPRSEILREVTDCQRASVPAGSYVLGSSAAAGSSPRVRALLCTDIELAEAFS